MLNFQPQGNLELIRMNENSLKQECNGCGDLIAQLSTGGNLFRSFPIEAILRKPEVKTW